MKTALINNKRVNLKFVRDDQIDTMSTPVFLRERAVGGGERARVYTRHAQNPGHPLLSRAGALRRKRLGHTQISYTDH